LPPNASAVPLASIKTDFAAGHGCAPQASAPRHRLRRRMRRPLPGGGPGKDSRAMDAHAKRRRPATGCDAGCVAPFRAEARARIGGPWMRTSSIGAPPSAATPDASPPSGRRPGQGFAGHGWPRIRKADWSGPVSRVLSPLCGGAVIISLGPKLPRASSSLPGRWCGTGRPATLPEGSVLLPVWPCSEWGLPSQIGHPTCW